MIEGIRYLLIVALLLALTGCSDEDPSIDQVANVGNGQTLYTQYCSLCHGPDGAGGEVGRAMGRVPDLRTSDGMSQARIARVVLHGQGRMRGWAGMLELDEAQDIAAYVKRFAHGG